VVTGRCQNDLPQRLGETTAPLLENCSLAGLGMSSAQVGHFGSENSRYLRA
jgi:hypothetical protein